MDERDKQKVAGRLTQLNLPAAKGEPFLYTLEHNVFAVDTQSGSYFKEGNIRPDIQEAEANNKQQRQALVEDLEGLLHPRGEERITISHDGATIDIAFGAINLERLAELTQRSKVGARQKRSERRGR